MKSEDTISLLIPVKDSGKAESAWFVHSDNIVIDGSLGEVPELTKAVRQGDLETISVLCARLFALNSAARVPQSSLV